MKGKLLTLLFGFLLLGQLHATDVQLSGHVFLGEPPTGTPDYPVFITSTFGDQVLETVIISLEEGFFEWTTDHDFSAYPELVVTVNVFDFCTGEEQADVFTFSVAETTISGLEYFVCTTIIPPPPPEGCEAFFYHTLVNDDPLTVQFFDLSYSEDPIMNWQWDFGDGTTSTESEPVHVYGAEGEYPVTLTIQSESCAATVTALIYVSGDEFCDCDYNNYDPVCVADPATGTSLFFVNPCVAACEGYGPDEFVNCDDDCSCPDIFDPVCVVGPNGDFLTFSNACYAACEGFAADDFVECGDQCICPAIYDPVCVVMDNGETQTFENACFAQCEGYQEGDWFSCDPNNPCDCDDVFDPVCVATIGAILFFPNACYAECEGFSPEDFVNCNDDCSCPDIFDPVCVVGPNGDFLTFSNACYAVCEGFTTDDFVECGDQCICPAIYDPVCVVMDNGETLTFENACFAQCEGYEEGDWFSCDPNNPCNCDDIFDPVCVATGGAILTFPNACYAACEGFGPEDFVECGDDCGCPDIFDPVCVVNPDGTILTFSNACFALCQGFGPDAWLVDCDPCNCDDVFDPVCVATGTGIFAFPNACHAECQGFSPEDFVDCGDDCICPDIYDPVCVVTADGETLTFENACFAQCEGFEEGDWFSCEPDDPCDCEDIYAPVCIATPSGIFLPFDNACLAICAGFEPWMFVNCNQGDACFADFYIDMEDPTALTVTFIDQSWTQSGAVVNWLWDFGDGTTGTGAVVSHTYAEEGVYEVLLTIATSAGCAATTYQHVCVGGGGVFPGPDCQAIFYFEQSVEDPATLQFVDLSFGNIESWNWDFGDGTTSEEQNPVHTYAQEGIYLVTLIVANAEGCTSTISMLVFPQLDQWYNTECTALFIPFFVPEENLVFLLNLSSPDVVTFEWDLGDGTTSTDPEVVHTYVQGGTYTITLTITTANGCTNSFEATLNLDSGDIMGSPEFSLLSDTDEVKPITELRVYPNPARQQLTLDLKVNTAQQARMEIVNLAGQVLRTQALELLSGVNQLQLPVENLPEGLYLMRLQTKEGQEVVRFVKQ